MDERPFSPASFRQYINERKLMASECGKCGALYLPPRPICSKCHSTDMKWHEMQGEGKLAAYTAIAVGPSFMLEEGFDRNNPYCTGVVELEKGVRISARIVNVDPKQPDRIGIGTPLTVEFLEREGKDTALVFKAQG